MKKKDSSKQLEFNLDVEPKRKLTKSEKEELIKHEYQSQLFYSELYKLNRVLSK